MSKSGYVATALLIGAVGAAALVTYLVFSPTEIFAPPRVVSIRKGDSMTIAARKLAQAGVVRDRVAFAVYAKLTGGAKRVKPGDYAFKGGEAMPQVLTHLVNGDFMVVTVIIPEGMTVHQIGARLEQQGLVCENEFDAAARGGPIVAALGLGPLGAEGFLFPATYRFSPLASRDSILKAMLGRFYEVLTPAVEERMFQLNLTAREMVTMASIIEKEAKVASERPKSRVSFTTGSSWGCRCNRILRRSIICRARVSAPRRRCGCRRRSTLMTSRGCRRGRSRIRGCPSIHAALYPAAHRLPVFCCTQ